MLRALLCHVKNVFFHLPFEVKMSIEGSCLMVVATCYNGRMDLVVSKCYFYCLLFAIRVTKCDILKNVSDKNAIMFFCSSQTKARNWTILLQGGSRCKQF